MCKITAIVCTVLSDERKRAIYDNVGPEGLKLDGWKLVPKQMTAQDIIEEYQRLTQNKLESKMLTLARPRGVFTVSIDASDIFTRNRHNHDLYGEDGEPVDDDHVRILRLPNIEISSMSASMSVEHTLETNHAVRLNGAVNTKNGTGGGSIGTNYKYSFSPTNYVEVVYQIGLGPVFTLRGHRKLSKKTSVLASVFLYNADNLACGFRAVAAHYFKDNLIGKMAYKEGFVSSLTTSLIYTNAQLSSDLGTSLRLSTDRNAISLDLGYNPKTSDTHLSVTVGLVAEDGLEVEYGVRTRVSEISTLGAALAFSVPSGVTLKICYNRANQEFNFPIYLADELSSAPIFYGTVIPILTYKLFCRYR